MNKEGFLKDIGKRLKELRDGKTQKSVCKALSSILGEERTKEAYQHYEAGRRLLPSDVLWGLSQIYGVPAGWILNGKGPVAEKKSPDIMSRFSKDTIYIAELVQSLSKKQKEALKVIIKLMERRE